MKILILCAMAFLSTSHGSDLELISKSFSDHAFKNKDIISHRKNFFFIGKVEKGGISIAHYNNEDLSGGLGTRLGIPKDNDFGRTSGLVLKFFLEGENGELEIEFENWLFSTPTDESSDLEQIIEEETTIAIRSRIFFGQDQNKYIVIGVSFNDRVQRPFIMTWLQDFVHSISSNSQERDSIERKGHKSYLNAILGIGGRYDLIKNRHIAFYVQGEAQLQPSTEFLDESNITLKASIHFKWAGWQDQEHPFLHIRVFYQSTALMKGEFDEIFGAEFILGFLFRDRYYFQIGMSLSHWNTHLDRIYSGISHWQYGIFMNYQRKKRPHVAPLYVFH